jgi:hypothetical protein
MPRATRTKKVEETSVVRPQKGLLALGVVLLVGVAASAGAFVWGTSDAGQIDVSATIANSNYNSEVAATGQGEAVPVPVSNALAEMPNGGLAPQDPNTAPTPIPETTDMSTTTGTTTEGGVEGSEENTETASSEESASGETPQTQTETQTEGTPPEAVPVTEGTPAG